MNYIASAALKNLQRPDLIERRAFLNGTWATRVKTLTVSDPATGEDLVDVAACSVKDADVAVDAAKKNLVFRWGTNPQPRRPSSGMTRIQSLTRLPVGIACKMIKLITPGHMLQA
jgi:hypothetical protein